VSTQVHREAKLNLEAVEPSELAQVKGGLAWFPILAIGIAFAAGNARAREDAAREAAERAAIVTVLKQQGVI
jgi:hypothetical protein